TAWGVPIARFELAVGRNFRVSVQICAKLGESGREQARRVRLRDAERRRDFGLAHVAEVPAADGIALAAVQPTQAGRHSDAGLARAKPLVRRWGVFGRLGDGPGPRLFPRGADGAAPAPEGPLDPVH